MNWGFSSEETITKMAWERGTWGRKASQHPASQPSPSCISLCRPVPDSSSSWPAFPTLHWLRLQLDPLWKTAFWFSASYPGACIRNFNFMVTQSKKPICPTGMWAEPRPRRQCGRETSVGSKGNSLSSQSLRCDVICQWLKYMVLGLF